MNQHEQFEEALRIVQGRRMKAMAENLERTDEINRKIPEVAEINRRLSETSKEIFKAVQQGEHAEEKIRDISRRNLAGQELLRRALLSHGYPEDYLELHYACDQCDDTGYIRNGYCDCLKRELNRQAVREINQHAQLSLCSFESFSLDYYRSGGEKCYATMQQIHTLCRQYAAGFSTDSISLLMIGKTGLGKTHLSLAIANEVLQKGYTVLYDSIINVLRRIEREHFGRAAAGTDTLETALSCELLILDDLGAEFETNFYVSTVYNIINTRLNRGLPTIISTNLSHEDIQKRYEDRIVSRLFAAYTCLAFSGTDIRLQKRNEQRA